MRLDGAPQMPPKGVLASATDRQNRITWQPQSGVRIALVVQHFGGTNQNGYVLVGRSLKDAEVRETTLLWMAVAAVGLVVALGGAAGLGVSRLR
jgi:hypothetical protein